MLAEEDPEGAMAEPSPMARTARKSAAARNNLVRNAFAILQAFRETDDWLTSSELSHRAALPKSSGHRLVLTLEELGALVRGPQGRYRPGMLLVSLAQMVVVPQLLRVAGNAVMQDLARQLNHTVHMGVLEDGMVTYVDKVSTHGTFPPYTRIGSKLEAYCSGLGKVLLAALPADRLENFILEGDLIPLTPKTITDRAQLQVQLEQVRLQGYAVDDCEYQADMRCVAVPVRDGDGRVVAALSVTGLADVLTMAECERIQRQLTEASRLITERLTAHHHGR